MFWKYFTRVDTRNFAGVQRSVMDRLGHRRENSSQRIRGRRRFSSYAFPKLSSKAAPMKYSGMLEEELKNKVAQDYFRNFDCTNILGKIDFAVKQKKDRTEYFLWAEAKAESTDIYIMLTQLVLTIGKGRHFDKIIPPQYLGGFDNEKIAFIPYYDIQHIFYINDFNWKIAPSNNKSREFQLVYDNIQNILSSDNRTFLFTFDKDSNELKEFIKNNFIAGKTETTKIRIDKNNFITIYGKWLESVKQSISVNWEIAKRSGIIDGDFYLADLLSSDNKTLKEKLFVLLKIDKYELDRKIQISGLIAFQTASFSDGQKAHNQFWAKYERPPIEEYWDYIIERRDLLVPQDVRERKGSFFTPRIWVELSQKYIADVLEENWQDEYYIWDCAAGTGNLLAGLTNKYNIWASTLDKADVDVMKDRINNGANLLENHVFQFDFLNDEFSRLPDSLQSIIKDEAKRKKLIIYINPPYAEVSTIRGGKAGVNQSKIRDQYSSYLGTAGREVFAQFMVRIYNELPGCILAEFSKLKSIQGSAFDVFRSFFQAKLEKMFVVPAYTFDNVKGKFPIGFKIWKTTDKNKFEHICADIYDSSGNFIGNKTFYSCDKSQYINKFISQYKIKQDKSSIGYMDGINGNDFQHNNIVFIVNTKSQMPNPRGIWINIDNLIPVSVYFTVRKCVDGDWINDRDQFLCPNDNWKIDKEFQNDCLTYTLFNNNIQSNKGINHWIPYTESEVNSRDRFSSHFMTDFITGKARFEQDGEQMELIKKQDSNSLHFSDEAKTVFNLGRLLWSYYHEQDNCNVNASFYDIRDFFQGRDDMGNMKIKSDNTTYNELISNLRSALRSLEIKIQPKVYEYGFLKQ